MVAKRQFCPQGHDTSIEGRNSQSACRECQRANVKEWAKANPTMVAAAKRRAALKKFGLTVEGYDALLLQQGGKCAVCGRKPGKTRLAVDHDHEIERKTGRIVVRGLLCRRCNRGMGAFEWDDQVIARAITYLQSISEIRQTRESQAA